MSYGGWGAGVRAAEQLRNVAAELQMVTRSAIAFQCARRLFDEDGNLRDADFYAGAASRMLDELVRWADVLRPAHASTPA